uniref:Uncharacterized protein n=1 Tax=Rhizophora mucronata TaxID=61149 RepID=A0A2P2MDZ9_RHIMU
MNLAVIRRATNRQIDEIKVDDHLFSLDVRRLLFKHL